MRRIVTATAVSTLAVGAVVAGIGVASADNTSLGNPGAAYVGTFDAKHVKGYSLFVQDAGDPTDASKVGANVQVFGAYKNLDKQRPYFTVIYGNRNCDPAQAFPVGPFVADGKGKATLAAAVPANGVNIAGSGSISVRYADVDKNGKATDQDGDGKTGSGDVVAVAGKPSIGLVQCDKHPDTCPGSSTAVQRAPVQSSSGWAGAVSACESGRILVGHAQSIASPGV